MSNIARFVRLDVFAVRPYARALALVVGMLIVIAFAARFEPLVAVVTVTMSSLLLFPSYLFALDERAGLDRLYGILPTARRTVVTGRYTTLLLGVLFALAVGTGLGLVLSLVFHTSLEGLGVTLALLAAASVALLAIQVPLFFRFGYLRARFVSYVIVLGLAAIPAGLISVDGLNTGTMTAPPAMVSVVAV